MTTKYAQHVSPKTIPQTEPIPGKPMQANNGGGFSFVVDKWSQLERFLILGAAGGTYYVTEKKLTVENAQIALECATEDYKRAVDLIVAISVEGRAPKNDPAIFALALIGAQGTPAAKLYANSNMHKVCRIGTHLFAWVTAIKSLRGWSKALSRAVREWYTVHKTADQIAYQFTKYQQRDGMSHRDVMRLAHVPANVPLLRWAVNDGNMAEREVKRFSLKAGMKTELRTDKYPAVNPSDLPQIVQGFEAAKKATDKAEVASLIRKHGLTREMVPTQFLNEVVVWDALLEKMPLHAMIRNLGKMTSVGLLKPMSDGVRQVVTMLADVERLRKSRVHPLAVLTALKIYAQGHGDKGSLTWSPDQSIVDALDTAFYASFPNAPITGKRWMLGIDVSASMGAAIAGSPLSCCEAATALALVTTHNEPVTFTGRFNNGFEKVPFGNKTRLEDALRYTRNINGGGTDCAMPMLYALQEKIPVDVFVTMTDNETNSGRSMHATQALKQYRDKMGIGSKNIVCGMTATGFTVNYPSDAGGLDVVGFSTTTPLVMANFVGVPKTEKFVEAEDE